MLGRFKPVSFDPYGRRRSRRMPRWLVLLLVGAALGAGGVVLVQERYLPPRLSAGESQQLHASYERAEAERQRLQGELAVTAQQLAAALAEKKGADDALEASRQTIGQLREDVVSLVSSLPPDPRGGTVEVRAARFTPENGALAYDVVLTRSRSGGRPLAGVLQFVVAGENGRGGEQHVTSKPVAVSVAEHEGVRGSVPLPEGFRPRQATVQVLDRPDGKRLGMRVINVR